MGVLLTQQLSLFRQQPDVHLQHGQHQQHKHYTQPHKFTVRLQGPSQQQPTYSMQGLLDVVHFGRTATLLTLTLRHCLNCVCVTWPYSFALWSSWAASSKKGLHNPAQMTGKLLGPSLALSKALG